MMVTVEEESTLSPSAEPALLPSVDSSGTTVPPCTVPPVAVTVVPGGWLRINGVAKRIEPNPTIAFVSAGVELPPPIMMMSPTIKFNFSLSAT